MLALEKIKEDRFPDGMAKKCSAPVESRTLTV